MGLHIQETEVKTMKSISHEETNSVNGIETRHLVRASTVARMLDVCVSSVYRSARRGTLPCVRLGRTIRFNLNDVIAVLENQAVEK